MDIITLFDYPRLKICSANDAVNHEIGMLLVWIQQAIAAKTTHPTLVNDILIFSTPDGIDESVSRLIHALFGEAVKIVTLAEPVKPPNAHIDRTWILKIFKTFIICSRTNPFVFIDSDAIFIEPSRFEELTKASLTQPVIGVDHQIIPRHTAHLGFNFLNSGFLAVSQPDFLKYSEISNLDKQHRSCPGDDGDQGLFWNFFLNNGYKYTHLTINSGWNACGGYKLQTTPGKTSAMTYNLPTEAENGIPVAILHYWHEFKPWYKPCPIYDILHARIAKTVERVYTKIFESLGEVIVNCSAVVGPDPFNQELTIGAGWKFSEMPRDEQESVLSLPRVDLPVRNTLAYFNFDITTDVVRRGAASITRSKIRGTLIKNGFTPSGTVDFSTYLKHLGQSCFVFSPEGNGIDCHRHYEAWMMGAVPIIEYNAPMMQKYKGLPILWTKDYSEITEAYLKSRLSDFIDVKFDFSPLAFSHHVKAGRAQLLTTQSNFWISKMSKVAPNPYYHV